MKMNYSRGHFLKAVSSGAVALTVDDVRMALSEDICRCAACPVIMRTVIDAGKVMRGEAAL